MRRLILIGATVMAALFLYSCRGDSPSVEPEPGPDPVVPPEEPEKKDDGIRTAEDFCSFLEKSSSSYTEDIFLAGDLDFSGITIKQAIGFGGKLKGNGHKICNLKASAPIFAEITGSITGLVIDASCEFKGTSSLMASLVGKNSGTLTNVRNEAPVTFRSDEDILNSVIIGGVAAISSGRLYMCDNSGAVTLSTPGGTKAVSAGGVVGHMTSEAAMCTNSGSVTVKSSYCLGKSAIRELPSAFISLGGIAGSAYTGFSAQGCTNDGEVNMDVNNIEKGSTNVERNQIGGIIGSSCGAVSDCNNNGNINVTAVTANRTACTRLTYVCNIGGICGGDYLATDYTATDISRCVNTGDMSLDFDASNSYTTIGGIVGWPNKEDSGVSRVTNECNNKGNISVCGAGKARIGGIMGGTGNITKGSNSGNIHVSSAFSESIAGGICGFHSCNHKLTGCTNIGNVVSDTYILGASLMIGCQGNTNTSCGSGCKISGLVRQPDPERTSTGAIVGHWNGTSASVKLAEESSPIEISASIDCDGREVKIDKDNFLDYLAGSSNSSTLHTFYTTFGNYPSKKISGHVKYSDGTPASGISVSDGFTVSVTDANGFYELETREDSWYIFVSYPSDAVITKNSDGCPDFYRKLSATNHTYDFTFGKQTIENDFMVYVMADPQAHYVKRSGQNISDTDRFLLETVPAINSQASKETYPCYGLTLGDIVYSEGGRDSTPGFKTMREHFGKLSMPVFQTMGNHDYTFFSQATIIKPDATSSTFNMKTQRVFEDCFGPINFSFNRGDVHFVCMRNILYDNESDASYQHGGFTDSQYDWLVADLANVPTSKMVVLCVHIPLFTIPSGEHVKDILGLIAKYRNSKVFSGHTHYKIGVSNLLATNLFEHIHAAVCGQWWWSNLASDGCPNGYYIYQFEGASVKDEYFIGVNTHMNTRDYQMRIYRGSLKTGGPYAYFQWPHSDDVILINVFNGDSRWKVSVYENGALSGEATLMKTSSQSFQSVDKGETYSISASSSQDWWAIGYNIGVAGRGTDNTSYYTSHYHMYKYVLKDKTSKVTVVAKDPYGREYISSEIVENGTSYPEYVSVGNHD